MYYSHNRIGEFRPQYEADGRLTIIASRSASMENVTRVAQIVFAKAYIRIDMSDGTNKQVTLT